VSDRGKARIGSSLLAMALFATFAVFSAREGSPQSCTPGSFSSALVRAVTYEPRDVAIADFDQDGRLDVALSLKAQSPTQDAHRVRGWRGRPRDRRRSSLASTTTLTLAVGDFDGTPDISWPAGHQRVQPVSRAPVGGRSPEDLVSSRFKAR
jgi:hypothetical protein